MTTTNSMSGSGMGTGSMAPDIRVPSGYEVESATFHVPVEAVPMGSTGQSGFRGRLDGLKSRATSAVQQIQHQLAERKTVTMSSISTIKTSMRDGLMRQMSNTQDSMRTSPMKWAGIAAGSGFALGMMGRYMHWRNYHRRMTPDLVIIDASC